MKTYIHFQLFCNILFEYKNDNNEQNKIFLYIMLLIHSCSV